MRWNERAQCAEIKGDVWIAHLDATEPNWERLTDRREALLRERVALITAPGKDGPAPMTYSDAAWRRTFLAVLARRSVDPFLEWLAALAPWDGVERIDNTLSAYFCADDDPLSRWTSRYILLGAILRAHAPGAKLDQMVVLIGPQGIGKSAFIRELLPPDEQSEWFADGINLADDSKRLVEALDGRVLVEVAEMAGSTRAELEALKAFISRTDDGSIRRAYMRNATPSPRRCMLVGTTNDETCLPNDSTGLRRFVPIRLKRGCDIEAELHEQREQLWAEALDVFDNMEDPRRRISLPANPADPLRCAAADAAEEHRHRDDILEDKVAKMSMPQCGQTLEEIFRLLEIEDKALDRRLQMRLAKALTNAGYSKQRDRRQGRRRSIWFPPAISGRT